MAAIFQMAASVVNIYMLLCFIRIIMTWFPGVAFTGFGRFMSAICDPFLNIFRGVKWLKMGMVDFSPMLALGILSAVSSILNQIAFTGIISIGVIIEIVVRIVWSVLSSLCTFLLVLLIVRLLVMLFSKRSNYYGSIWSQLDSSLSPLVFRLTSFLFGGRATNYRSCLLATVVLIAVLRFGGEFLVNILCIYIRRLPI